ncbi:MAG: ice-binding family protein [Chloroflexota bacterium]|nr:ice-binding family protein [Chloroflexota bacterium]
MEKRHSGAKLPLWAGIVATLAMGLFVVADSAFAAGPAPVGLGTAAPFAVLAGTGMTNTGTTTIVGDVGSSPTHTETGFGACPGANCVTLTGTNHNAPDPNDTVTQGAKTDLTTAYTVAAGLPVTANHGTLAGLTLPGGVYNAGGVTLNLTGTVTLDGQNDPSSVWVFQATSDLITASSSRVALINGANPCNVFWQVTSSATLGSGSTFVGTIMALTSISMANGVTVTGRALARNGDVTLINDTINASACSTTAAASGSPTSSGVPNTAFQPKEPVASWPLFLAMIALVFGLTLMVVAHWRAEEDMY